MAGSGGGGRLGPFDLPPPGADFRSYSDLVASLPDDDKSAMFGLPANIERSYQRNSSAATVAQLRTLSRFGNKFIPTSYHTAV